MARFIADADVERLDVLSRGLDGLVVMLLNARRGLPVADRLSGGKPVASAFVGAATIVCARALLAHCGDQAASWRRG